MEMKLFIAVSILIVSCHVAVAKSKIGNQRQFLNSRLTIKDKHHVEMVVKDSSEVSFLTIGDWGGLPVFPYRTLIENSVSHQMTYLAQTYNTQFQLGLGDNFYFKGVQNAEDPRFQDTYEKVFTSEHLVNTPWFFIMGNHDHYGNASAQVAYTDKFKRWILPSMNYTIDVKLNNAENQTFIRLIMIDTVTMCGNTGFDFEDKAPLFASLEDMLASQAYFDGIEDELKKLETEYVPYVIVSGHFPVWSVAEHGPTKCLVDKLRPLLHKYNVSAYFCGHDHDLQHLTDTYLDQTVEYMVIGASNFVQNSTAHANDVPPKSLKYYWAAGDGIINGGQALVRANPQNFTFTFVETNGKDLYEKVLYPRFVNV